MTLSNEQISFIQAHIQVNTSSLLLKYGQEKAFEIAQIEARQKARLKLPTWYAEPRLVFPPAVSVEQSSSELTGHYKASLVAGQKLIDATGGMGIDTYFFSKHCLSVNYVEQKELLVQCARHNFEVLEAKNIQSFHGNSLDFLHQLSTQTDVLYVDPARRTADNRRVVGLRDCEPDVVAHLPLFLAKAKKILIKAAPLLDLKQALNDIPAIKRIHVVAIENECKELLFEIEQGESLAQDCFIKAINFRNDGSQQIFDFQWQNEATLAVKLSDPLRYVYEPNATILKAGAFKSIANAFGLAKIAPHSHLYTSENLVTNFPGRIFELNAILKADSKALAPYLPDGKANLTVRNFPVTTDELRKKLKLKDGGEVYILATTLANGDKRLLVCTKAIT